MADTKEIYVSERVSLPIASAVDDDEATSTDAGLASFSSDDFVVSDNGLVKSLQKVGGIQYQGTIVGETDDYYIIQLSDYSDADTEHPKVNDKVMLIENYVYDTTDNDDDSDTDTDDSDTEDTTTDNDDDSDTDTDDSDTEDTTTDNVIFYAGTVFVIISTANYNVTNKYVYVNKTSIYSLKGESASIEINEVETLDSTESAYVENIGTIVNAVLNFGIPKGVGISSISRTSKNGLVDTYTIYLENNNSYQFTVTNGNGISSIDKINENGLEDTYTITFKDGSYTTFTVTNGNGISSIAKTYTSGLKDTYTITFKDGSTTTFTVTNGADGADGEDGVGISSITGPSTNGLVDTYTVTLTDNKTYTFTVTNGEDGEDGTNVLTWTTFSLSYEPTTNTQLSIVSSYFASTPVVGDNVIGIIQYTVDNVVNGYLCIGTVDSVGSSTITVTLTSVTLIQYVEGATVNNNTYNYNVTSATATANTVSADSEASVNLSISDGVFSFIFDIPQGAQGEQGEQGIQGEQGVQGADGADGKDGADGTDGEDGENAYLGVYDATDSNAYSVSSVNVSSVTWNITPSDGDNCTVIVTEYLDSDLSTIVTNVCTGTISGSYVIFSDKVTIDSYSLDASSTIDTITTAEIDELFSDTSSGDSSGDDTETEDPIYGVSWTNDTTTTMTRTDDATDLTYTINSSAGTIASDFDGVFPWTQASIVTDDNDNVFLQMPEMYFRVDVDDNGDICGVAVSASEHDDGDWYRVAPFWYSCYGGYVTSSMLCSVSGVSRTVSTTRANFRTYAANNGDGYCQLDNYHKWVMVFLWWIEFATKNSQDIMTGNIYGSGTSATTTVCTTGNTDILSTPSGFVTSTAQMRWHYIEDFVGNLLEWLDGITWSANVLYVSSDPDNYSDSVSSMQVSGIGRDETNGNNCVIAFGWYSTQPFQVYASKTVSDSNYASGFCDYARITNSSYVVVSSGAGWNSSGSAFGLVYLYAYSASSSNTAIGGRLLKWLE